MIIGLVGSLILFGFDLFGLVNCAMWEPVILFDVS